MKKVLLFLTITILFYSCSSIKGKLYYTFIDTDSGKTILQREPDVKKFLENILDSDEYYSMKVFVRTGIHHQKKRTDLITHSYYVFFSNDGECHTLSYYGTDMTFYSEGAWVLDALSDLGSYLLYLEDNNKWDVAELFCGWNIDVKHTVENIIDRMDSDVTYYYRAHLSNKQNADNCNTALYKTIVLGNGTVYQY
jgi:uncharacterized protein YceK